MFSLRSVFIVTAIVALLAGIFTTWSVWLVSAFFAVALLLSLWGAMERRKPFWRGFAYFGVGYMLVTTIPALSPIGGMLPTTMILIPNMSDSFTDSSNVVESIDAVHTTHAQLLERGFFVYALLHIAIGMFIGLCAGLVCLWRTNKEEQKRETKGVVGTIDR